MGVKLRLEDFKNIFDVLDYDNRGTIDFSKFCHLNADRYTLIDLTRMKVDYLKGQGKRPPLAPFGVSGKQNLLSKSSLKPFDASITDTPKNKSVNSFINEI